MKIVTWNKKEEPKFRDFVEFLDDADPKLKSVCPDGFFTASFKYSVRDYEGPDGHPSQLQITLHKHNWTKKLQFYPLDKHGNRSPDQAKHCMIGDDGKIRITGYRDDRIFNLKMKVLALEQYLQGGDRNVLWKDVQTHCVCRGWGVNLEFPAILTASQLVYEIHLEFPEGSSPSETLVSIPSDG